MRLCHNRSGADEQEIREVKPDPNEGQDGSSAPSSNPDLHTHQSPAPSAKKEKDHQREIKEKEKEKEKHKKKKGIDKNMIIRVGGGGMGMVNPMGWYDERGTPGASPTSPPRNLEHVRSSEPKVIDHAHSTSGSELKAIDHAHSNSQVWGGVETPDQQWGKAPDEEKALRPSRTALGLDLGSNALDDDPDQVFTASPEDEHSE